MLTWQTGQAAELLTLWRKGASLASGKKDYCYNSDVKENANADEGLSCLKRRFITPTCVDAALQIFRNDQTTWHFKI